MAFERLACLPTLAGKGQKEATFVLNMTADWPGLDEEGKSVIFQRLYLGYMLLSLPTDGRRPSPPPALSEVTQSLYHLEWHRWLQLAEVEVNKDGAKISLHNSSNNKDNHSHTNNEAEAASPATTTTVICLILYICSVLHYFILFNW